MVAGIRLEKVAAFVGIPSSGVDLLTIQAWLGHAQVATTHRYAAADVEMMRRGLEKAGVSGDRSPRFRPDDTVLQLLANI